MNLARDSVIRLLALWLEAVNIYLAHLEVLETFHRPPTDLENADGRYTRGHETQQIEDKQPRYMRDAAARIDYHRFSLAKGILQPLIGALEESEAEDLPVSYVLDAVGLLRAVGVETATLSNAVALDVA